MLKILSKRIVKDKSWRLVSNALVSTTKYILLAGNTGEGKSAIGNCLVNQGDNARGEVFHTENSTISVTTKFDRSSFTVNDIKYVVMDSIGFSDTSGLTDEKIIRDTISEAVDASGDRLDHIFFVFRGRFDKPTLAAFNLVCNVLNCKENITLLRNGDEDFRKPDHIAKIINEMEEKILKDKEFRVKGGSIEIINANNKNKEDFKDSYNVLLNHLTLRQHNRPFVFGGKSKSGMPLTKEEVAKAYAEKIAHYVVYGTETLMGLTAKEFVRSIVFSDEVQGMIKEIYIAVARIPELFKNAYYDYWRELFEE